MNRKYGIMIMKMIDSLLVLTYSLELLFFEIAYKHNTQVDIPVTY